MNSKTQIINLLGETTELFVSNCSNMQISAVGSIMLSLARLDQLIKGEAQDPASESQDKTPDIDATDIEAIKQALAFMRGFYDDDTQLNVRAIVDNLQAFYNAIAPQPVICEWSSKDIGEEVFKQLIERYLNNDLQVVRILVNAMDDHKFKEAVSWVTTYKGAHSYHWPVNVDWNEFIECLTDYHNGQ